MASIDATSNTCCGDVTIVVMATCLAISNCDSSTSYNHNGVIVSVGVTNRNGQNLVMCCIKDSLAGCQHLMTRQRGAMILIESVAHALLLLP